MQPNQREIIHSDNAPKAIGPYSVGVRAGQLVFTAGQIGIDPATGEIVSGGIEAETQQVMQNLQNILKSAGSSLDQAIKTTVFLRDINDFSEMNGVYGQYFQSAPPARSTIQVAGLPKGAAVEIEVVAWVG